MENTVNEEDENLIQIKVEINEIPVAEDSTEDVEMEPINEELQIQMTNGEMEKVFSLDNKFVDYSSKQRKANVRKKRIWSPNIRTSKKIIENAKQVKRNTAKRIPQLRLPNKLVTDPYNQHTSPEEEFSSIMTEDLGRDYFEVHEGFPEEAPRDGALTNLNVGDSINVMLSETISETAASNISNQLVEIRELLMGNSQAIYENSVFLKETLKQNRKNTQMIESLYKHFKLPRMSMFQSHQINSQKSSHVNSQQSTHLNSRPDIHLNTHKSINLNSHQSSHLNSYQPPQQTTYQPPQQTTYQPPQQSTYQSQPPQSNQSIHLIQQRTINVNNSLPPAIPNHVNVRDVKGYSKAYLTASTPKILGQHLTMVVFTDDELKASSFTGRLGKHPLGKLPDEKTNLIKRAIFHKFPVPCERMRETWKTMISDLNTYLRTVRFRLNSL